MAQRVCWQRDVRFLSQVQYQLVPAYSHLLLCRRVEGAICTSESHTRVALKQSGCLLPFWGRATKNFARKRNTLCACNAAMGTLATVFERMQPAGVSNNRRTIAVPFECKVTVQIPRKSSLCTDGRHGDWALEGIYVRANDSTCSFHVHLFKTNKTEMLADQKAFPDDFHLKTQRCSWTRASSQQKMSGAYIRKMMLKKRISSAKSAQHQSPQNR